MTPQPSEPRTKEGRALLASLASGEYRLTPEQEADYTRAILAIEAEAAAPDPVASPPEAVRLLAAVLDQFDYWTGEPRAAADEGKVRLHDFWEVQPAMEKVLAEARRFLEGAVATPAPLDAHAFLDSLRSPRNSLGKLALPKGPMEWAVADAWDEATSPVGDPEDGIEMHELSVLADAIIDHLHPRLEGQAVAEEPE